MNNIRAKLNLFRLRQGFTLIELVAVMIVIGFIMAIALPRYFSRQTYEGKGYYEKALNLFYFSQKVAMARNTMPYEDDNFLKVNTVNFYSKTSNEGYINDVYMYVVPKPLGSKSLDGSVGTIETFFADRYAGCKNGIPATKPTDFTSTRAIIPVGSGLTSTELNNGQGTTFRLEPQHNNDIEEVAVQYLTYKNKLSGTDVFRDDYQIDPNPAPLLFKFDGEGKVLDACNNPITKIIDIYFKVELGQRGQYFHVVINPESGYIHPGRFNSKDNTYGSQIKCKIKTGGKPDVCQ